MADRALYRGHALQAIDGKGRVAVPAALRAAIERNSDDRVMVLAKAPGAPFLIGADAGYLAIDHERQQRAEARALDAGREIDSANIARLAFGGSVDLPFDASGRFILPGYYRDKASLADLAFFIGTGDRFEIWAPQILIDAPDVPADLKDIVAYHLDQRRAG